MMPKSSDRLFSVFLVLCVLASAVVGQGYDLWKTSTNGHALAAAGDIDGDGIGDLIVGAPVFGRGSGRTVLLSGATGATLRNLRNSTGSAYFGFAVASVGDLDGDGTADVLVGTPFWGTGRVDAFSGASGVPLFSMMGPEGSFGGALAGAGDVDGDGVADFLVGLPSVTVGTALYAGQAQLVSGATQRVLWTWSGGVTDGFGSAVAGLGDVDGDGVPDVAVGAPEPGTGGFYTPWTWAGPGYVNVYSGATGQRLFGLTGAGNGDAFGKALAAIGDIDGDGTAELLIGAPQYFSCSDQTCYAGPGYAQLFSGATGARLLTMSGSQTTEKFGLAVSGLADVDGDGVRDMLVGAPGAPGGRPIPGSVHVLSGATGGRIDTLGARSRLGAQVVGLDDVDGDGFVDVAIGEGYVSGTATTEVFSLVGIPAGSALVGRPCTVRGGSGPRIMTYGGSPDITTGNAGFGFSISAGVVGAPAALYVATASNPTGLLVGGCRIYLAGVILPVVTSVLGPVGSRLVPMAIPSIPALAGTTLTFQWLVLDAGSPNGVFTTSAAVGLGLR